MLSCLSAAAALPRPPPRKVARAFANPVLRLLPDAHRLASLRGRPPGRAVAAPVAREAANRAASAAAPARRDRRPADSVFRGLRRRVGGRALGGNRHLSALLCFSLVRPWEVLLTSFRLLLSYATWLCVFGFLCLRFGFWIFYDSLFIYLWARYKRNKTPCCARREPRHSLSPGNPVCTSRAPVNRASAGALNLTAQSCPPPPKL